MTIRDDVPELLPQRQIYTCDEPACGKSYARREHLTRHKLNHAEQKYECAYCTRKFVRRDLLVRHQTRHTRQPGRPRRGGSETSPEDDNVHPVTRNILPDFEESLMQPALSSEHGTLTPAECRPRDVASQYFDPPSLTSMLSGNPAMLSSDDLFPLFGDETFFGNTSAISTTADLAQYLFSEHDIVHNDTFPTPSSGLPTSSDEAYPRHEATSISDSKLLDMLSAVPHHLWSSPLLKTQNLNSALGSFWTYFHFYYPVLHHATFEANSVPSILLWTMIAIGSFYTSGSDDEPCHGTDAFHSVMTSIMDALRWTIFSHPNFKPPASLWLLQSLIMLEIFEKFCSSRQMHERGHIFHSATITLMRRGSTLGPNFLQHENRHNDDSLEKTWRNFIALESAKRCAFLAFIVDTNSAMMFGHVQHMNTFEIKWSVPCSDRLWTTTSAHEWSEIWSKSRHNTEPDFLSELKEVLLLPATSTGLETTKQGERLSSRSHFTKIILLYGLVSVSNQLWQKQSSGLVTESSSLDGGGLPGEMRAPASDVSRHDSTDPFPAQSRTFEYTKTIVKALKTWKRYSIGGPVSHNEELKAHYSLIHHYTIMSFNSDIIDLQILAGSQRCLGRPVSDLDRQRITRRIRSWAQTENAAEAVHHAVQLLKIQIEKSQPPGAEKSLLQSWLSFHATLVCWAYGNIRRSSPAELDVEDRWQSASRYLDSMDVTAQTIPFVPDLGRTWGLLEVVTRDFLCQSRSQVVYETALLLSNCVRDINVEVGKD